MAGFGTRLYPATRALKKDFFPIPCPDGMVRPVILILLEELVKSGVEEICLVLGSEEERIQYTEFFERQLSEEHLRKLNKEAQEYENRILDIGKRLHYVYQHEKRGFGHAVFQAVEFAAGEPVLLLLFSFPLAGVSSAQMHALRPSFALRHAFHSLWQA